LAGVDVDIATDKAKVLNASRALHSHRQLKRERQPIRGTVWMGKGVQGVVRRATTIRAGKASNSLERGIEDYGGQPEFKRGEDSEVTQVRT
jgi:hypothetical protein